ncbi:phospholipase B1, membrane-associated-like [Bradysia coprophila]|uniref:phospholipase B1, membrane-associated-like n=1 Tax=Bradysia coprophila TaxID=38358 RepID=UPI00187D7053|nr:phospholipase B1, membrane-associated-like [Bradysia coprophila]XP_037033342.1 phospholipase B1, membrane-associated-like [Bradysia coprophila]
MTNKVKQLLLTATILLCIQRLTAKDIVEETSMLDSGFMRSLFHSFRDFTFRLVGSTSRKTRGNFLQEPNENFPCDLRGMRSKRVPTSVHRLKPGDIDVIAAIGDSLTAASGATSTRFQDLFMENRGLSWSIGGQWNWRNVTTLPNILKEYNPKLVGYSRNDAYPFHEDTQFNMAEIGAVSADIPFMAKALVRRIKRDKRINFKKDWKMVTICMGGNDICSFICLMQDPESLPEKHRNSLIKALRYMRDNMPRTFVNIVPVPLVETVVTYEKKPLQCQILHHGECSCWVGRLYNQTKELQERYSVIQRKMQDIEEEVASMKEFRGLKEFAVMYQPFSRRLNLSTETSSHDFSLLAFDCFHMSQKGNAWAGVTLWNSLLEPPGSKSLNWVSPKKKFLCPTTEQPYFYTHDNYRYFSSVNNV